MSTALAPDASLPDEVQPRSIRSVLGGGDRAFLTITFLGGLAVLGMTVAVGVFLAAHALGVAKWSFLTTQSWQPDVHRFGIAAVITGTVLIAVVALVLSFPLALGTALFISEIAPNALKRPMVFVVDLLAAVPSVVY